jgi:hypothetical protein
MKKLQILGMGCAKCRTLAERAEEARVSRPTATMPPVLLS